VCRLFAQISAEARTAERWLIDAERSMSVLSHENQHGVGLASFADDGSPLVKKWPTPAYDEPEFHAAARETASGVLIGHVRWATPGMGHPRLENAHPFVMDGRVFAHNGAFDSKQPLEDALRGIGANAPKVHGDTDTERYYALLTDSIRRHDGDVPRAVQETVGWMRREAPACSYNFVMGTRDDLWALRYPDFNGLYIRSVPDAGHGASAPSDARSGVTLIASEPLDHGPGWSQLESGSLVHARRGGDVQIERVL
jgi:predicted glutamine amidotransferase